MKAKVVHVEQVTFSNGTKSNKVSAIAENNKLGIFYTNKPCKPGSIFELEIGTDAKQGFSVQKRLVQE